MPRPDSDSWPFDLMEPPRRLRADYQLASDPLLLLLLLLPLPLPSSSGRRSDAYNGARQCHVGTTSCLPRVQPCYS